MHIEFGNANLVDTQGTGWIVGFSEWAKTGGAHLRYMPQRALAQTLCIKWSHHPQGDPHGSGKPLSEGRSLAFLVSAQGRFRLEFSEQADFPAGHTVTHVLATHGDFVLWGAGLYHRWCAEEDPQEGTCDKTSFALPSACCIAVPSFCTGSSTLESLHRIIPLIEHESSRMV